MERYRVVGEQHPADRRVYWFISGDGLAFRRSCPIAQAPFKLGERYTQVEIDMRCPSEPRRS
jgi:hypothetical protein